jgi:hypothetical protein
MPHDRQDTSSVPVTNGRQAPILEVDVRRPASGHTYWRAEREGRDGMRDGDKLQKAFLMPVGHWHGSLLVWRPGADPAKLYRRTWAFKRLVAVRAAITIGFLIVIGFFVVGESLVNGSVLKAIGIGVVTALLGSILWVAIAESGGGYTNLVREVRRSSLRSVPDTELYWPSSALERRLVRSLEIIQHSRAVATGIVGNERVTELHKHTWTLLTSQGVTQDDVDALQQAATEITEIDQVLAEQESKTDYDHAREAGKTLQDHSQAMADELRLFREFLKNERDE